MAKQTKPAATLPKLKPCPFCNSGRRRPKVMKVGCEQVGIACPNCGAELWVGPNKLKPLLQQAAVLYAVNLWNRRGER